MFSMSNQWYINPSKKSGRRNVKHDQSGAPYVTYIILYIYIAHINAVTEAEVKSDVEPTKDTPYLTLTGELWGVFCV